MQKLELTQNKCQNRSADVTKGIKQPDSQQAVKTAQEFYNMIQI